MDLDGFLIPVRNTKILADRIIDLLSNAGKREKFGKAGRVLIVEKNNCYNETEKMEYLYQKAKKA